MKKLLILFSLLSSGAFAQNKIQYIYDDAGNRKQRNTCINCRQMQNPPDPKKPEGAADEASIQLAQQHGLNVFPNPTQDKVVVSLSNVKDDEPTAVLVTDEAGKTIYSAKNLQQQSQIDMSNYQVGVYFVKVSIGKDVLVYKIMKIQ